MNFSESSLLKKLQELNNTQQSVQTLSLWLIHHRKYSKIVVNTWLREIQASPKSERKLTFMYLANDILQNSRKKGYEYMKEFSPVLEQAIENMSRYSDSKTYRFTIERILNIWKERKIFPDATIEKYKNILHATEANPNSSASASPDDGSEFKRHLDDGNATKSAKTSTTPTKTPKGNKEEPTKPIEQAAAVKKRKLSSPNEEQKASDTKVSETKVIIVLLT